MLEFTLGTTASTYFYISDKKHIPLSNLPATHRQTLLQESLVLEYQRQYVEHKGVPLQARGISVALCLKME